MSQPVGVSLSTMGRLPGPTSVGATLEAGLFSHLSIDSDISATVGTRVYLAIIPQDASLPAITYQRISGSHVRSLEGSSGASEARYQITAWASTGLAAKQLADYVRLSLDGFSGAMGDVTVKRVYLEDDRDQFEPAAGNDEERRNGVLMDFSIWYHEAKPSF